MKNALIAILLCGVAVAACDARRVDETEQAEAAASSVDKDWDEGAAGETGVNIKADMEKGEVELKLSGARSLVGAGLVVPPVKVKLP